MTGYLKRLRKIIGAVVTNYNTDRHSFGNYFLFESTEDRTMGIMLSSRLSDKQIISRFGMCGVQIIRGEVITPRTIGWKSDGQRLHKLIVNVIEDQDIEIEPINLVSPVMSTAAAQPQQPIELTNITSSVTT